MYKDKVYILAYTKNLRYNDEQIIYLIDEERKIKLQFYYNGYDGMSAENIKNILNFFGIRYFECVYSKFPEKYNDYEEYNWRARNESL